AALVAGGDLLHIVLEAPQGGHLALENDDAVAHHAHLAPALHFAVEHIAAADSAHLAHLVELPDFDVRYDGLLELGRQHALHCRLNLVYAVVDDAVGAYLHIRAGGVVPGGRVWPHVEADHQRPAGRRQHHVALVYGADA